MAIKHFTTYNLAQQRFILCLTLFLILFSVQEVGGENDSIAAEQARFRQLPPIVFAPSGRLHRVERVCHETTDAWDTTSSLVVAMKCEGGNKLVLVYTSPLSPYLMQDYYSNNDDTNNETEKPLMDPQQQQQLPLSKIGEKILLATAGNAMASIVLQRKIQRIALSMIQREERIDDPAILARHTADILQIATQSVADEDHPAMLASSALLIGATAFLRNNHTISSSSPMPKLWRVDPTGQFWDCEASAIGRGAEFAEAWILRRIFNNCFGNRTNNMPETEDDEILRTASISNDDVKQFIYNLNSTEALMLLAKCVVETLSSSSSGSVTGTEKRLPLRTWGILNGVIFSPQNLENKVTSTHNTFSFVTEDKLLSNV